MGRKGALRAEEPRRPAPTKSSPEVAKEWPHGGGTFSIVPATSLLKFSVLRDVPWWE
jgi:hypothetical protein